MKIRSTIFVAVLLVASACGQDEPAKKKQGKKMKTFRGKIVGGEEINWTALPYQASIRHRSLGHFCGGTVIDQYAVLTASHCVEDVAAKDLSITTGSSFLSRGGKTVQAKEVIMHPRYNSKTVDNDLAIIITKTPIQEASRIKLAKSDPSSDEWGLVSGWGKKSYTATKSSETLNYAWLPGVPWTTCYGNYEKLNKITTNMICFGFPQGGVDACQGDSGGPMVTGDKISGVTSWGNKCALPNQPGVFASVARARSWIIGTVKQKVPSSDIDFINA